MAVGKTAMPVSDPTDARRGAFFGRRKGHALRPRQAALMETLLPKLAVDLGAPAPAGLPALFPIAVDEIRLEIGFGGDIADYAAWTLLRLIRSPAFAWTAERADDWRHPWPGFTRTRYEAKAEREGRVPCYLIFRRIDDAAARAESSRTFQERASRP